MTALPLKIAAQTVCDCGIFVGNSRKVDSRVRRSPVHLQLCCKIIANSTQARAGHLIQSQLLVRHCIGDGFAFLAYHGLLRRGRFAFYGARPTRSIRQNEEQRRI